MLTSDDYLKAEKELAELCGWGGLRIAVPAFGTTRGICFISPNSGNLLEADIPPWTRDDESAFRLMIVHHLSVTLFAEEVYANNVRVNYLDHPDHATATRYAIVMAVIAKLKS